MLPSTLPHVSPDPGGGGNSTTENIAPTHPAHAPSDYNDDEYVAQPIVYGILVLCVPKTVLLENTVGLDACWRLEVSEHAMLQNASHGSSYHDYHEFCRNAVKAATTDERCSGIRHG